MKKILQIVNSYPIVKYNKQTHDLISGAITKALDIFKTNVHKGRPHQAVINLHFDFIYIQTLDTSYVAGLPDLEALLTIITSTITSALNKLIFLIEVNDGPISYEISKELRSLRIYSEEVTRRLDPDMLFDIPLKPFKEMPKEFREGTILQLK